MADMWQIAVTRDEYEYLHSNYQNQMIYVLLTAEDSEDPNGLLRMTVTGPEMEWALQSLDHEGIRFSLNTAMVADRFRKDRRLVLEDSYRRRYFRSA